MDRIRVDLTETSFAYNDAFISWNPKTMETIDDFHNRLRVVFNLKPVDIFVCGCWLPPSEPISLIDKHDIIKVIEKKKSVKLQNGAIDDDVIIRKTKRKETKDEVVINSDVVSFGSKTSATEPEIVLRPPTKEEEMVCIDAHEQSTCEMLEEQSDILDDSLAPREPRRKRRRKHKKRKIADEDIKANTVCEQKTGFGSTKPPKISENANHNGSHIRFEDHEVPQGGTKHDGGAVLSDWQENLLNMAQQGGKRVFVRSEVFEKQAMNGDVSLTQYASPNPVGQEDSNETEHEVTETVLPLDWESCPIVETAKPNELIYFKRLTIIDWTPTPSHYILALIEDVIENQVTLKILKGQKEELFTVDEIQEAEGGNLIVKLKWEEMIEPRLVTERSLLSAYL